MKLYVVKGNQIQEGTFRFMRNDTVFYNTAEGSYTEHVRNVFFTEKNANYHLLQSLGRMTTA